MRPELKGNSRSLIAIRGFLEELHVESLGTQLYGKVVGRGDAMDVEAVADKWAWLDQAMAEEARHTAEEWANWFAWPPVETDPGENNLDAAKGKGKGKSPRAAASPRARARVIDHRGYVSVARVHGTWRGSAPRRQDQ